MAPSAPPLTREEFVSLRDGAKGLMHRIPSEHKARLIELGHIPIFHPRGDNQQKSNRECNERRTEAGPFRVRIVWMVMMKPMKASARRIMVKDNSVHQIFQQRPGRDAH